MLAENYVGLETGLSVFDAIFAPAARCSTSSATAPGCRRCSTPSARWPQAEAAVGPDPRGRRRGDRRRAAAPSSSTRERIAREGRGSGNPAEPLVRALRAAVGGEAAGYVHYGATSQDIVDTAAMLVSRRALELVLADVAAVDRGLRRARRRAPRDADGRAHAAAAGAADDVRAQGRDAGSSGVLEAERLVLDARDRLAVQLGGAAGTLAALGEHGPAVMAARRARARARRAARCPGTPRACASRRSARRSRRSPGALGKIALDVVLMAQTEVGELSEPAGEGRGGSSTMAHKRNPIGSTLALACARRAQRLRRAC